MAQKAIFRPGSIDRCTTEGPGSRAAAGRLMSAAMKILLACLLAACASGPTAPPAPPAAAATAAPPEAGIDRAGIDSAVAPGDDFFAYANGAWIKSTAIPPDRSSWGTGGILAELTARRTADLIAEAARTAAPEGSDARKIGDYYNTFMDEAGIEAKGLAPLQPQLAAIAAIGDKAALARVLGSAVRDRKSVV